jgi:hypothetical protein
MNFYLEETTGKRYKRLYFPIVPNELSVTSGANTIPFNIIKTGESRVPRGLKATGYSWEGMLPGKTIKSSAILNVSSEEWQAPRDIIKILDAWTKNGTSLKFVAGKFVNDNVFIESFNKKFFGQNHCKYSITLTKYPTLTVSVSKAPKKTSGDTGSSYPEGKVNKDKVAYRKGPGHNYTKIGKKNNGDKVTVYGTKGNWYKINDDDEWWICKTYVTLTSGQPEKTGGSGGSGGRGGRGSGGSTGGTGGKQPVKVEIPTSEGVQPPKLPIKPQPTRPPGSGPQPMTQ